MTLTNEQIEALAKRLGEIAEGAPKYSFLCDMTSKAAAALRQLVEERDAEHNAAYLASVEAAILRAERDREDRLLGVGWALHMTGTAAAGTLCYHWHGKRGLPEVWNPDRATAARLAAEKMEKP